MLSRHGCLHCLLPDSEQPALPPPNCSDLSSGLCKRVKHRSGHAHKALVLSPLQEFGGQSQFTPDTGSLLRVDVGPQGAWHPVAVPSQLPKEAPHPGPDLGLCREPLV